MAVTHYDPYPDAEETELAMCGTKVGENYEWSSNWDYVSCKKCIQKRNIFQKELEIINEHRSEQDGDFVDFISQQSESL